jgi:hypothetical protein
VSTNRSLARTWPRQTRPELESAASAAAEDAASRMLKEPALIAAIYAPVAQVQRWIESELDRDGAMVQTARSVAGLVKALVEDPTPRPNVLVLDLDATTPVEVMELHTIRQLGWFGSIIAIGHAPTALRQSLWIDQVLTPPLVQDQLRDAIATLRAPQPTVRIPVIPDAAPAQAQAAPPERAKPRTRR